MKILIKIDNLTLSAALQLKQKGIAVNNSFAVLDLNHEQGVEDIKVKELSVKSIRI